MLSIISPRRTSAPAAPLFVPSVLVHSRDRRENLQIDTSDFIGVVGHHYLAESLLMIEVGPDVLEGLFNKVPKRSDCPIVEKCGASKRQQVVGAQATAKSYLAPAR